MKKALLVSLSLCCSVVQAGLPELEKAIVLTTADGKPITSEGGCAAPVLIDIDGDGKRDLVVGEFGNALPGLSSAKTRKERLALRATWKKVKSGRARIYLNQGSDMAPRFSDYTYLQAGGKDAAVKSFCCIGLDPYFVDLNKDGLMDVVSGEYYDGLANFYQRKADGSFAEGVKIPEPEMDASQGAWLMRTINFTDFDGDGDADMLSGEFDGGIHLAINEGSKSHYQFPKRLDLTAGGKPIATHGKSDPLLVDWDEDGVRDLLVGTHVGDILFFKGKAAGSMDFEPGVSIWTGRILAPGEKPDLFDVRQTMDALGEQIPYPDASYTRLSVADWNKDGKLDLLVGNSHSDKSKPAEVMVWGHVYLFLRK